MKPNLLLLNIGLAVAWAAVTADFSELNLLFGFVLGFLTLYLPRQLWPGTRYFARIPLLAALAWMFIRELVLSSLRVARVVVTPGLPMRPALIALPLDLERDIDITLLANLVTLTPGTLSLDVSADRRILYIHAMDASDAEALKVELKTSFERAISRALG